MVPARMLILFIRVQLFANLWTIAHHGPLSVGFSRQEYWNGLPWSPPENLLNPGTETMSHTSSPKSCRYFHKYFNSWRSDEGNFSLYILLFLGLFPLAFLHFNSAVHHFVWSGVTTIKAIFQFLWLSLTVFAWIQILKGNNYGNVLYFIWQLPKMLQYSCPRLSNLYKCTFKQSRQWRVNCWKC